MGWLRLLSDDASDVLPNAHDDAATADSAADVHAVVLRMLSAGLHADVHNWWMRLRWWILRQTEAFSDPQTKSCRPSSHMVSLIDY